MHVTSSGGTAPGGRSRQAAGKVFAAKRQLTWTGEVAGRAPTEVLNQIRCRIVSSKALLATVHRPSDLKEDASGSLHHERPGQLDGNLTEPRSEVEPADAGDISWHLSGALLAVDLPGRPRPSGLFWFDPLFFSTPAGLVDWTPGSPAPP